MPILRFVVIDRATQEVYGHTLDLDLPERPMAPVDVMCHLDRRANRRSRGFAHVNSGSSAAVYDVYQIACTAPPMLVSDVEDLWAFLEAYGETCVSLVPYNS